MKTILIATALLLVTLIVSALCLVSTAHAMDDEQWDNLRAVDNICFKRHQWENITSKEGRFEPGFELCEEIERQFRAEVERRKKETAEDDRQDLLIYFSMYPLSGKLSLGGKKN